MKKKMLDFIGFVKRIWRLPQVRTFFVLLLLAILMIITSALIDNAFWASFFSNISAGLFTGLVICLVSGRKAVYLTKLYEKKGWLEQVHNMILEFKGAMAAFRRKEYNETNEYDFVYDLVCKANWVNEFISQSHFDKTNSFDGDAFCREELSYDSYPKITELNSIRDEIMSERWDRKAVLELFEPVEKSYWLLNHAICRKIDAIEMDINNCDKSVI